MRGHGRGRIESWQLSQTNSHWTPQANRFFLLDPHSLGAGPRRGNQMFASSDSWGVPHQVENGGDWEASSPSRRLCGEPHEPEGPC